MRRSLRCLIVLVAVVLCAQAAAAQSATTVGTLATAGDTVLIPLVNVPSVAIQFTGIWAGTPVFEVSADNSVTWQPVPVAHMGTGASVLQVTTNGLVVLPNAGYTTARVRAATWGSGTATVSATRGFGTVLMPPCNALLLAAKACK